MPVGSCSSRQSMTQAVIPRNCRNSGKNATQGERHMPVYGPFLPWRLPFPVPLRSVYAGGICIICSDIHRKQRAHPYGYHMTQIHRFPASHSCFSRNQYGSMSGEQSASILGAVFCPDLRRHRCTCVVLSLLSLQGIVAYAFRFFLCCADKTIILLYYYAAHRQPYSHVPVSVTCMPAAPTADSPPKKDRPPARRRTDGHSHPAVPALCCNARSLSVPAACPDHSASASSAGPPHPTV